MDSQGRLWTHECNITINQNTGYLIVNNITEIRQTRDVSRDLICKSRTTNDPNWTGSESNPACTVCAWTAFDPNRNER